MKLLFYHYRNNEKQDSSVISRKTIIIIKGERLLTNKITHRFDYVLLIVAGYEYLKHVQAMILS